MDARHPGGQGLQGVVGPQPEDRQHVLLESQVPGHEIELPVHDLGDIDRQFQALLHALALAQVAPDSQHANQAAIAGVDGYLGSFKQFAMAVVRKGDPLLLPDERTLGDDGAVVGAIAFCPQVVNEVLVPAPDDGVVGRANQSLEARVAGQKVPLRIFQPDDVGDGG